MAPVRRKASAASPTRDQACACVTGMLRLRALSDEARKRLGERYTFSDRAQCFAHHGADVAAVRLAEGQGQPQVAQSGKHPRGLG